jgi:hypothetical protein
MEVMQMASSKRIPRTASEEKPTEAQDQSVIITPKQARAVLALQFERQEIERRANEQIAEIMGAFQEQGRMLALMHQLPRDEGITYRFESVDVDGAPRVKLIAVPAPEPEAEPDQAGVEQLVEEQGHD